MRRLILSISIAVILIAAVTFAWFVYLELKIPIIHEEATLVIQRGTPLVMIGEQLKRAGVIKRPILFTGYARFARLDRKVKAGEYTFENGLTTLDVLKKLAKGECRLYKVTFIEGWTMNQMADYIAAQPFAGPNMRESFLTAANDKYLLKTFGVEADSAEGYLFPDTYLIERPKTAEWVIKMLVDQFHKVYTVELQNRAHELGMTTNEVITIASIIEKETGREDERGLISSVFHNRLKKNMPLQADPTVIYGLKDFDGNLRKADLSNPHPYNTYVHPGLPPAPIANPGLASIRAALWPADSEYIYFVARGDGSHEFTKTLAEHQKAVVKYQLKR
jgi:UPF0755 protein